MKERDRNRNDRNGNNRNSSHSPPGAQSVGERSGFKASPGLSPGGQALVSREAVTVSMLLLSTPNTVVLPVLTCFLLPAHRKAVKATLVLLPLLGITYMLFFVNPGEDDISQIVFIYFNSFLQSFQVREQAYSCLS